MEINCLMLQKAHGFIFHTVGSKIAGIYISKIPLKLYKTNVKIPLGIKSDFQKTLTNIFMAAQQLLKWKGISSGDSWVTVPSSPDFDSSTAKPPSKCVQLSPVTGVWSGLGLGHVWSGCSVHMVGDFKTVAGVLKWLLFSECSAVSGRQWAFLKAAADPCWIGVSPLGKVAHPLAALW